MGPIDLDRTIDCKELRACYRSTACVAFVMSEHRRLELLLDSARIISPGQLLP